MRILRLKLKEKKAELLVVISFFVIIFTFLYFTGTINSGYHYIDDHEMLAIDKVLQEYSLGETMTMLVQNDLNIRFRPMYYVHRVLEVKVFGVNFFGMAVYTGFLAAMSCIFIFFGSRRLRYNSLESLFLVLLTLVGAQTVVWWSLGPAETIGAFFLALTFYLMTRCLSDNNYRQNSLMFAVSLTAMSLCKESFLVIVPAFVLFKIWNEKIHFNISAKESLKRNIASLLPLAVMIFGLYMIKYVIGTNQIGYAGVTSSFEEFIEGVKGIFFSSNSLLPWLVLTTVSLVLFVFSSLPTFKNNQIKYFKTRPSLLIYVIFSLMIIIPEVLMNAKSGMVGRYLLPTTFGLAFLVVGMISLVKTKVSKIIIYSMISVFLVFSFDIAKKEAIIFGNNGAESSLILNTVVDNAELGSSVLVVADPVRRFELIESIRKYLLYHKIDNFFFFPMMKEYTDEFDLELKKQSLEWHKDRELQDMNGSADVIIIFDKIQTEEFFTQSKIVKMEYKNVLPESSPSAVLVRKNEK